MDDNDHDQYVEDEDEFFDALEVLSATSRTAMQSAAPEQNVDMFSLTGYESESQSHRANRRHRLACKHKKGAGLGAVSCCGGMRN